MNEKMKTAFESIKATQTMKDETCAWLMGQRDRKRAPRYVKPVMSFAVFCFALYWVFFLPVAYISVDVNPSIELTINRLDHVIKAEAYNEVGEKILSTLSLNNQTYEQAVETLLKSDSMQPYLGPDSALTITVASSSAERSAELERNLSDCAGIQAHHGMTYSTSVSIRDHAHECGMSFGKYGMYERLCESGEDLTVEECRNMNMKQLNRLLSECESSGAHGHHHGRD